MRDTQKPIYLDYHSTTPVEPTVLEAMLPYFSEHFGNPASRSHPFGWQASEGVEIARSQVSELLSVDSRDIYFTSGATEGLNLAVKGIAENLSYKGKHIITVATEHHAVIDPLFWLAKKGYDVTFLPVETTGLLNLEMLKHAIRKDTIMVVVMWANNETGILQDVDAIGKICRENNVAFICDATQAVGKITVLPIEKNIDVLVMSSHKLYGPKGCGAIYIGRNQKHIKPQPLIHGGGHEGGFRSGTLNVPGIVGLGMACEIAKSQYPEDAMRIGNLRNRMESKILSSLENVEVNGSSERLPTVSNFKAAFVDSQAVMTKLRTKLSISSGSACSSADPLPSHVLLAMGLSENEAKGSFRISVGRPTTIEDVDQAANWLCEAISEYRMQNPVWQMFINGKVTEKPSQ